MDASTDTSFEESRQSVAGRVTAFFRSILPEDPAQLFFLVGTIFLLITMRLPWRIESLTVPPDQWLSTPSYDFYKVSFYVVIGNLPVLAGGLFALYACFWPVRCAVRKLLAFTIFPSLLGLFAILWMFFSVLAGEKSIFSARSRIQEFLSWLRLNWLNFSAGQYFVLFGLLLISAYCLKTALGAGSLPITLSRDGVSSPRDPDAWRRVRVLIFVLVGPITLLIGLPYLLAGMIAGMPRPHTGFTFADYTFQLILQFSSAALVLGISLFTLGKAGWSAARHSLRISDFRPALIALALPVAVFAAIPFAQYVADRIHWAAHDFRKLDPPILATYFDLGLVGAPWIVWMVFGAFVEEIVFRGIVLDKLIRWYGLHRGIVLTGLAWAATHFRSDSYSGQSTGGVMLTLALRIMICLGMNYVFAWMFLRWRSVIPSGIAHTVWNMLVFAGVAPKSDLVTIGRYTLWFALAYILYRFWPIASERNSEKLRIVEPEPAT